MESQTQISHQFCIRMEAIYETLTPAEKKAANVILRYPDTVRESSIVETAKRADCSEATLVRLSKRLGYHGYPKLKESLFETVRNTSVYEEIEQSDSCRTVVYKVFESARQALSDTLSRIDYVQYEGALRALKNASKIMFLGAGDAYIGANSASLKFMRMGYNVMCSTDFDLQLMEAGRLNEKDVLFVISHSGRTQTVFEVQKKAIERNACVIAITNYPMSPIAKHSDIVLLTASFARNGQNEIMAKRISELGIIESLYANLLQNAGQEKYEEIERAMKSVSYNKIR